MAEKDRREIPNLGVAGWNRTGSTFFISSRLFSTFLELFFFKSFPC